MEELKFRVWVKDHQVMSPPATLADLISTAIKHPEESNNMLKSFRDKKSVIMRCTGLKDKYGVDIYEDDVLRIPHSNYRGKIWHEFRRVTWSHANSTTGFNLAPQFTKNYVVAGNVWENPELRA